MTGVLYSFQGESKEVRCFMDKGFFGEVMKSGKPMNS